jgi:hypothetical protein
LEKKAQIERRDREKFFPPFREKKSHDFFAKKNFFSFFFIQNLHFFKKNKNPENHQKLS